MPAGEAEILRVLQDAFPHFQNGVGIGDDAAILNLRAPFAVTSDMLVEDVDFTSATPIESIARKSLEVNLSDLAAMGATPSVFLLVLAFPGSLIAELSRFVKALAAAALGHRIQLVGGDLSRAREFSVTITAFGSFPDGSSPLLRSGAQPGDRIYVSRPLGASAAGLRLLQRGWTVNADGVVESPPGASQAGYSQKDFIASVIRRHLVPSAEVELGIALSKSGLASACIDISDGFSTDLHRLCDASGTGARIDSDRLPLFPDLSRADRLIEADSEEIALHGGEEFSLLFTSALREADLSQKLGRPVYAVGVVTREREVLLEKNGKATPLMPGGFDHFAAGGSRMA